MTNDHVIENAARITVKLDSGEEFAAKVVGTRRRDGPCGPEDRGRAEICRS